MHTINGLKKCKNGVFLFFAFVCIVLSLFFIYLSYKYQCFFCNLVGIATTFSTLSGAILVFSTLELQRKSLNEEKQRNEIERFNSRFYPILSSFRTDASNIVIQIEHLSLKGIETNTSYNGERAFAIAKNLICALDKFLGYTSFAVFDKDEFDAVLNNYSEIIYSLDEDYPCPDDLDNIEKERKEYIKSNQLPYLINKWRITKEDIINYQQMDSKTKEFFLIDLLIEHQDTTLSKYIQSLRFILNLINEINPETERIDYYRHVSCLVGKKELDFLKCFSEFNKITNISNGKK